MISIICRLALAYDCDHIVCRCRVLNCYGLRPSQRFGVLILFVGYLVGFLPAWGQNRVHMQHMQQMGAGTPFMPKPMQDIGTSMHRAASRLVITLQDASVSPTLDTMRDVNRGLHEITAACTACHASYRIR